MGRLRTPTASNRAIGRELQKQIAQELITAYEAAIAPLRRVGEMDPDAVTWNDAVNALRELRQARHQIEKLQLDLMGAVILSGGTADFIADKDTGARISPRTLSRRLPHTPAALIGQDLAQDSAAPHGWRAVE